MLPPSHIAYTLVTLNEIQNNKEVLPVGDYFEDVDYRLAALAAVTPDLLDKPLIWAYFHEKYKGGRFFAHTLIVNLAILFYVLWKAPHQLLYALAFNGHAIADQMWHAKKTWYWPMKGWDFSGRRKGNGKRLGIFLSYWYSFTKPRGLFDWDVGGLVALLWFVVRNRLWERKRFMHLLRTGRLLNLEQDKEMSREVCKVVQKSG